MSDYQLYLVRGNPAVNGLITVYTDKTAKPYYKMHKPSELEELSLVSDKDDLITVTIRIGQNTFTLRQDYLFIEGVQQDGITIDQLRDNINPLFLESSAGGGGGTTDNTTAAHVPFKAAAGSFENSNLRYSIEPVSDTSQFEMKQGAGPVSVQMHYEPAALIRKILFGNNGPVVSPFDTQQFLLDFQNKLAQFIQETFIIGDENTESALIYASQAQGIIKQGDYQGNTTSVFAEIDTINEWIRVNPQKRAGADFNAATGETTIGDVFGYGNVCQIKVDDVNETIIFISSGSKFKFQDVQEYIDNATAIANGLTAGMLYCTKIGGENFLKVVN